MYRSTLVLVLFFALGGPACSSEHEQPNSVVAGRAEITVVPAVIDAECRNGVAKIYDECSDQAELLLEALAKADESGKTILVVYGAEWCIWCHVFDKHVRGQNTNFRYQWQFHDGEDLNWNMTEPGGPNVEELASELNQFVAENFIILYVESYYSPNGQAVLENIGFSAPAVEVVPQIFTLDSSGRFSAGMDDYTAVPGLEIRENNGEEYRGFSRSVLLVELKKLREQALDPNGR